MAVYTDGLRSRRVPQSLVPEERREEIRQKTCYGAVYNVSKKVMALAGLIFAGLLLGVVFYSTGLIGRVEPSLPRSRCSNGGFTVREFSMNHPEDYVTWISRPEVGITEADSCIDPLGSFFSNLKEEREQQGPSPKGMKTIRGVQYKIQDPKEGSCDAHDPLCEEATTKLCIPNTERCFPCPEGGGELGWDAYVPLTINQKLDRTRLDEHQKTIIFNRLMKQKDDLKSNDDIPDAIERKIQEEQQGLMAAQAQLRQGNVHFRAAPLEELD